MKQLGLVPAAKDQTVPEMPTVQIKPPAVPKLELPEAAKPAYADLMNKLIPQQGAKK